MTRAAGAILAALFCRFCEQYRKFLLILYSKKEIHYNIINKKPYKPS